MTVLRSALLSVLTLLAVLSAGGALAAPAYRVLGQPTLNGTTLASRCAGANARFNFDGGGGFDMHGPAGIAIDVGGRIFVTDFGGKRVLTWPNVDSLSACQSADGVIGAGDLEGPEAVAIDPRTGQVFVADTLGHTVKGYRKTAAGWVKFVTLGAQGQAGAADNRFNFPRGLAVDPGGRLFVADDFNNRIAIFNAPFSNGEVLCRQHWCRR